MSKNPNVIFVGFVLAKFHGIIGRIMIKLTVTNVNFYDGDIVTDSHFYTVRHKIHWISVYTIDRNESDN